MPPMTVENSSALVGGVPASEKVMQAKQKAQPDTVRVKVLRAFQGPKQQVLKFGAVETLPRLFALEMKGANRVEILPDEPEPPATPAEAPKDEIVEKPRRGSKEK